MCLLFFRNIPQSFLLIFQALKYFFQSYIRKKDDELTLVRQILSSTRESASPIASNTRTEIAEESIPMVSKTEPAGSIDSQIPKSHRSQETLLSRSRIDLSDDVQGKIAKESIPMASKEESSPPSRTEIVEESIRTLHTDSPCSTMIALAEIATNNKSKSDTKVKVGYLEQGSLANSDFDETLEGYLDKFRNF